MIKVLKYVFSPSFGEVLEFALLAGLWTIAGISTICTVIAYWRIFTH